MTVLYLIISAFFFGFFQKLADGHNEHGLDFFPHAGMLFAVIFGCIGFFLVTYNEVIMISYLSIMLYWIYKLKIDYPNHGVGIIIMFFGVFVGGYSQENFVYVLILFMCYIIADFIKKRSIQTAFSIFFRYRLQFIIIPIIYSIYINNIMGAIIIFNLVGVSLCQILFKIPKTCITKSIK